MRKFASLLATLMLFSALAFGQARTVSGTVRDAQGNPIPFATITERGTQNAAKADANGMFSIRVADNAQLVVTATGFQAQTVNASNASVISLAINQDQLQEVVVTTALGVRRRPKELGYSQSTVNSASITNGRAPNLATALSGRVAGLTIQNTSSSVNASPRITLRGNRSITGDNTALIVVDGVPVPSNTINLINPNDIENVTVLRGGQAAALYGSEGVNGVLVITTRKGTGRPQVNFTSTNNFESVSFLPKFNNTHGSGSGYGATPEENYRPFENQQYGDRYDGSIRAAGRKSPDGRWLEVPYAYTPKSREIWDRGFTTQNDISVSGGDATSSFYLSFQDVFTKGIVPKDTYRRDGARFNARKTFGKFTAGFDGNFVVDRAQRTTSDFYFFALNTPSWIPLTELKDWKNNYFATPNGYFNDYYNNPWYELDNNRSDARSTNFNGNLNLNFKATNWLELTARIGTGITSTFSKSWSERYDYSDYAKGLLTDKPVTKDPQYNDYSYNYRSRNTPITGGITDASSYGWRINSDVFASFNKDFGDFSGKLIIGNNLQIRRSRSISVGTTAIAIPGNFNIANRAADLVGNEDISELRRAGNYADLTMGYKDYFFVHTNFRYDQSSAFFLPNRATNLYSYAYYGADASIILTDAVPSLKTKALSYLKLRGGWNKNANDNLSPYNLQLTYPAGTGFPYGSTIGATVSNTFPDAQLRPEPVFTTEVGLEAAFWNSRINLDVSAYTQKVETQVLNISTSPSIGFTNYRLNAADLTNKGIEAEIRGTVIRNRDFTVDINANYTYNTNVVNGLFGAIAGFNQVELNNNGGAARVFAVVNQPFPFLKTTAWQRDSASGKIIVDAADGWPVRDANLRNQGRTTPAHQVGVGFRVGWKGLSLSANAEYRGGYVIYNDIGEDMAFTGSSAITTMYNREQFIWPNSVYNDGTGKYVPNTTIPVEETIANYLGWGDLGFSRGIANGVGELFVTNGAFWKIRDVQLAYTLPASVVSKLKVIKGATISLFGRNLLTWLPKDNIFTDPEFSNTNGNGVGINTSLNTPPTRQYGATLNVNF